jgi:hypothetical protein
VSRKHKKDKRSQPPLLTPTSPPAGALSSEVTAEEKAVLAQLLARGESGPALDHAKRVYKRCHNPEAEALLIDAYRTRILALTQRGLDNEARSMVEFVRDRFPAYRDKLRAITALFSSAGQNAEDLLRPLNEEGLPPDLRAVIYRSIRCRIADLNAIAECAVLPVAHPLRAGAAVLVTALGRVTTGPVQDADLALPEISRQSPLAPWKMLVRAIAAFYRREDDLCRKHLSAIEPGSAAARLIPSLLSLLGDSQNLGHEAIALVGQVGDPLAGLRSDLEKLDRFFDRKDQSGALREIRQVVAECRQKRPALLDRLRQHIWVWTLHALFNKERITAAIGGAPLKNAYYWRLMARAIEGSGSPELIFLACCYWEEFRRHAIHEKWFPDQGPEVAAVYLHIAELLSRIPRQDMMVEKARFRDSFHAMPAEYKDQPPEIRAVMDPNPTNYQLAPDAALARACEADPCAENFQRWLKWSKTAESPAWTDRIAERWAAAQQNSVEPLLHLMASAELRGAYKTAFTYMERAEAIDGVSAEVRKARLRLLISMATRHLQQKKTRLAWPELQQIADLPQTKQGDRRAYVAALNWVGCMILGRSEEAEKERSGVFSVFGDEAATYVVLSGAASACKFKGDVAPPDLTRNKPSVFAVGRAFALGDELGTPFDISRGLAKALRNELAANPAAADMAALSALGEAGLRAEDLDFAYAISAAGLAGSPAGNARFLFLRARSLPSWAVERQDDCLAAAAELARRQRDHDLLNNVAIWREQQFDWYDPIDIDVSMPTEDVNEVIESEKSEPTFPLEPVRRAPSRPSWVETVDNGHSETCTCPKCVKIPEEFLELVETLGPEGAAMALAEFLADDRKPNRKKKGK